MAECPAQPDSPQASSQLSPSGAQLSVSVLVPTVSPVAASKQLVASPQPAPPSTLRKDHGRPIGLKSMMKSTCYLNSVLQCLTFTPPLAEYCLERLHSSICTRRSEGDCTFCLLEKRIRMSLTSSSPADTPKQLFTRVMMNSDCFEVGRHEDAHELLRFLINDSGKEFESNSQVMRPGSRKDPEQVLKGMFGGVLQSHIECRRCGVGSTKHDEILDLSLEISQFSSLAYAIACFFRPEILDGDNKYRCGSCNSLSAARKRLSIFRAPQVLTIQLMRFDPFTGKKLNHHVQFQERISVAEYMSKKFTGPVPEYKLYGVLIHVGGSQHYGHYLACVKETNGKWYLCDDEKVIETTEEQVLTANAYLLFYIQSGAGVRHSV